MQASCSAGGGTGLAEMPGWPAWAEFAPRYLLILESSPAVSGSWLCSIPATGLDPWQQTAS